MGVMLRDSPPYLSASVRSLWLAPCAVLKQQQRPFLLAGRVVPQAVLLGQQPPNPMSKIP